MVNPDDLNNDTQHPESANPSKVESGETSESPDNLLGALKYPGAALCAQLGIERDLETKPLPKGYVVVTIKVGTDNPQQTFADLKRTIQENNGCVLDTVWTNKDRVGIRCTLPNEETIHTIIAPFDKPEAECADPDQPMGVTTYKGYILPVKINEASDDSLELQHPTYASIAHAKTLRGVEPDVTVSATLITAKFPHKKPHIKTITGFIDALAKPKKPIFCMDADNTLRIVIDGERSPGNLGQRLAGVLESIGKMKIEVELDSTQCQLVKLDDGVYSVQLSAPDQPEMRGEAGVFETERFHSSRNNERDRALAEWNSDPITGKITKIAPIYFEPMVGGPRKTVGREHELTILRGDIDALEKSGRSSVRIIKGPRGSGKTRLARDVIQYATKQGIPTAYYKVSEDGRTISGSTIKKLIQAVLRQSSDLTSQFKDLEFYASGVIPEGLRAEYHMQVNALNNEDHLANRFIKLVQHTCSLRPLYVALDDTQWIDPFSQKILKKWRTSIKQDDKVVFNMFPRDDEEMPDIPAETLTVTPFSSNQHIEKYIKTSLPEEWGDVVIPASFVQRFANLTHGLPLDITSVLILFIQKGHIKYEKGQLTYSEPEMARLETRPVGETLMSSVTQARFSHLSKESREAVDLLIICGDIDIDLFSYVLEEAGYAPEKIEYMLAELRSKGIITLAPFGFSFDAIPEERKRQYAGREQELSAMAIRCYECLKSKKMSPIGLFKILQTALNKPDDLTSDQKKDFQEAYFTTSQEALDSCLQTNDNRSAVDICKAVERKLAGLLESARTPVAREACARFLNTLHLKTAQACFRLGYVEATETYLEQIDELCVKMPEIQFRAGLNSLPYHFLRAELECNKLRLAKTTVGACEAYTGQLENILKMEENSRGITPKTRLARAKIALVKIKIESGKKDLDLATINTQASSAEHLLEDMPSNLDLETRSLRLEIQRRTAQAKFIALMKGTPGRDPETKLMHVMKDATQADEIIGSLASVKQACDRDSRLIMDSLGFCYISDSLARLAFMTQRRPEAEAAVRNGVSTAINFGSPEVLARLRKLQGDMSVYNEFRKSFTNPSKWNPAVLEQAIHSYEQGMAEMALVNPDALYVTLNALNRGRAGAMYALAKVERGEFSDQLGDQMESIWQDTCRALLIQREHDREDYLKQLATLGLMVKASAEGSTNIMRRLQLPREIQSDIASARELVTQQEETALSAQQPNPADIGLIALWRKGIAAWNKYWMSM